MGSGELKDRNAGPDLFRPEVAKPAPTSSAGHRQRLKDRFVNGGPESLPDYELLELVLFSAIPRLAVMQNVGPVVEYAAKAVPAEIPNHTAPLGFRILLDRCADMACCMAGLHGGNATHQGIVGDVDQPLGPSRKLPHGVHAAGVAVPAVDDQRHIDVDDIPVLEGLGIGDAVAHDVVDRCADRPRESTIVERCRDRLVVQGKADNQFVQVIRGYTRLHMLDEHVEHLRGELTSLAHAFEGVRPVQLDFRLARLGT